MPSSPHNVMIRNRKRLIQLFDHSVRRSCPCVGRQVERLDRVTRVIGPTASQYDNMILWSNLDDSNVDRELKKHQAYFGALQHDFAWFVYEHDEPSDLLERLQSRGFEMESEATVVISNAPALAPTLPPKGIMIRQLTDPADVRDSLEVSASVWGNQHHDFVHRWLTDLVRDHPGESTVLVAYDDDRPVGTSWATHWKGGLFASLFGGTVLTDWRGKGIYRAMVTKRAKVAADCGMEWCVVDAGTESFAILHRIGFESLTRRFTMLWKHSRK